MLLETHLFNLQTTTTTTTTTKERKSIEEKNEKWVVGGLLRAPFAHAVKEDCDECDAFVD
jgi:hypothetical protein